MPRRIREGEHEEHEEEHAEDTCMIWAWRKPSPACPRRPRHQRARRLSLQPALGKLRRRERRDHRPVRPVHPVRPQRHRRGRGDPDLRRRPDLKWRAASNERGYPFVTWQTEIMKRDFESDEVSSRTAITNMCSRPETVEDWGLYSQLLWGFAPRLGSRPARRVCHGQR
jgi:hypothetical protein